MKKNNRQSGFTIIEMLVSIAIVGAISGLFLANYQGTNKTAKLVGAAQKLVSDIRLAQNFCLGLKKVSASEPGGWGIYAVAGASSYIIFADLDENYNYDIGEEYSVVDLPENVSIRSIEINSAPAGSGTVVFIPPDPKTRINDFDGNTEMSIILENESGAAKRANINFLGLIDVE